MAVAAITSHCTEHTSRISVSRRSVGICAVSAGLLVAAVGCGSGSATGGGGASGPAQGGTAVSIKNFSFSPATLAVRTGTAVTFTNQDGTIHTATADDNSFDSKNLDQGKAFMFTFSTPGTFKYHCNIHTYMNGTVTVTG